MTRRIVFPVLLLLLGLLFFLSPTFKEVAAGIAILLFGMIMLKDGFNAFVQGPLHKWLKKSTDKLYKSLGLGFLVTALLQSSSLISVITISFLSAGLLDLYSGIGIIFGSNIGTTVTAWLVSTFGLKIKVSALAMPMLAFGIVFALQKSKTYKGIGYVLAGLGFFFLGIHFMKQGFDIYKDNLDLATYALTGFWGLMLFCGIGILITIVLQSSSAAMALILTALAAGQITYENSLALSIGANIGTTITAILGAASANVSGKRLAGAHFIFNIVTGIVALVFVVQLGQFVDFISDKLYVAFNNYVFRLSMFHTIFNVLGVLLMLPFIKPMVRFLSHFIKTKDLDNEKIEKPKYLNKNILTHPQTAFHALLNESKRLFAKIAFKIVAHGLNIHRADIKSNQGLKEIIENSIEDLAINIDEMYYQKVKLIYSKIIEYATLTESKFTLTPKSTEALTKIKLANRNVVEVIKDIRGLHKNVNQYIISDNDDIKKQYNRLRKKVSMVLREIHLTKNSKFPEEHLNKLEKLKLKAEKKDVLIDGTLDKLIREHKITSEMATSLANDSANVAGICKKLIETAELLYLDSDTLIYSEEINGDGQDQNNII